MTAETLMFAGGLAAFITTIHWVRKRHLREKDAAVWILVATLLLLSGLFPSVIMRFAESARLSYPAAVLFLALGAIYLFAFTVSVQLSRLYRRNVRLTQEIAILEHRLAQLEERTKVPGTSV